MRIEIDTKKDSVDDIRKTIAFLQHFISESTRAIEETKNNTLPNPSDGTFNMFASDSEQSFDKKEDKDDTPSISIIEY